MRIISLNVNGLRAFDAKNGGDFNHFCLNELKGDIICLQETKGSPGSLAKYHSLKDYHTFSSYFTIGRHGVSTLVRKNLFCEKTVEIVPGRILKTFHGNFVIYNCYMPYYDESREGDKTEIIKIYKILEDSLENGKSKRSIICGDLNATYNVLDHYQFANELSTLLDFKEWKSHNEIENSPDLIEYARGADIKNVNFTAKMNDKFKKFQCLIKSEDDYQDFTLFDERVDKINPKQTELPFHFFTFNSLKDHFYSVYQREWLKNLMKNLVDTFRIFNHKTEQYTCWNTMLNLRPANLGTRIDYVLCSKDMDCENAGIMPEVMGSDHCVAYADFKIESFCDDKKNLVKSKNSLLDFFAKKN